MATEINISDEMVKTFRTAHAEAPVPSTPVERVRAGLAAVLAGFEVREEWGVRLILADEGWVSDGWLENRGQADNRIRYHQHKLATVPGWRATPILLRRCVLKTPVEPVPDPPVREETSSHG